VQFLQNGAKRLSCSPPAFFDMLFCMPTSLTEATPGAGDKLPRSPELMSRGDSALLVVDVQGKLVSLIDDHRRIVWNIRRLIDGAGVLGVPVAATEQYPKGLGPTTPELTAALAGQTQPLPIQSKMAFSCGECGEVFARFRSQARNKILVAGIEAHVCVQQTVLDLLADGFRVYLAADAVGSRGAVDYQIALRRMETAGAVVTTTESALFEWCEVAGTPEFKAISSLVKEPPPQA
jgi:nicotinamidase-related amidase